MGTDIASSPENKMRYFQHPRWIFFYKFSNNELPEEITLSAQGTCSYLSNL